MSRNTEIRTNVELVCELVCKLVCDRNCNQSRWIYATSIFGQWEATRNAEHISLWNGLMDDSPAGNFPYSKWNAQMYLGWQLPILWKETFHGPLLWKIAYSKMDRWMSLQQGISHIPMGWQLPILQKKIKRAFHFSSCGTTRKRRCQSGQNPLTGYED